MRLKDLLRFFLAAAVFVGGMMLLSKYLGPNKPPEEKEQDKLKVSAIPEAKASPLTLVASFGGHLAKQAEARERVQRNLRPEAFKVAGGLGAHLALEKKTEEARRAEEKQAEQERR